MTQRILGALLVLLLATLPANAGIFCSEPVIAIPDNNPAGVFDQLVITHLETISDLDVVLEISHTWVSDLVVTLEREMSGPVTPVDRPGFADVGFGFGCSGDDLTVRLDDEATLTVENDCRDDPDPAFLTGGIYRPGDPPWQEPGR